MGLRSLLAATLVCCSTGSAAVSSTGFTVELGDVQYFLPPKSVATIEVGQERSLFDDATFVPFTAVHGSGYSAGEITSITAKYLEEDDVFQAGFLDALYIPEANQTYASSLQARNTTTAILTGSATLSPGPYFLSATGKVYEAWRLYSDTNSAFTETAISNGDDSYSVLPAGIIGQNLAIAVPSRLYYQKTAEKPLAGIRIGIKDIYDIKGLRTSNGNRAWYWLYPPANATATPVQNLIDAGAIVVGKMITSQFANGESATADWVSYHEAFNPRGDGYQDTSSSSSGGGAGAAAYEWLDITLGSDTGGSVRNPSQVQGVYGNRPSHGLVGLEHTMPMSPVLDTPGLLSRDPLILKVAAKAMYKENITFSTSYPSAIKTLGFPTAPSTIANTLLLDFVGNVSSFLNANVTTFNLSTAWIASNVSSERLESMLNLTYPVLITQQQAPLVRDPFYADYAAKHDGRRPFIDPVPLVRWGWGDNTTETLDRAIANKTMFMSWFNSTVLVANKQTCSDSLLFYVGTTGAAPDYRNVYLSDPRPPAGFGQNSISGFSEAPDYVVPIGEAPYNSTITGHVEYLPVAVDIMAAKGCDGMILSLIEALYEAGILKKAKAGRSGVTGGDILFKRGVGA
ncbi:glutamyl-tRNA amidotransferase [Lentithecium fluviatile CBS 122367]|uniref:Glutamyl-tRNA amidotransferase n=1 Tax=Lentithecium fluviatile CBS 122367 TaxID=1168545 RepID=A0A6G1ICX4_9PLEO|nr:glutamyl-tRNA amidotransferase [Lentithecium fluviatile CBS 122367]